MNLFSTLITSLQAQVTRLRIFLAAVLLRHEYETNQSLHEFNALDGDDFLTLNL
jgi:hypothetical protein